MHCKVGFGILKILENIFNGALIVSMKRILILFFVFLISFGCTACSNKQEIKSEKEPVTINLATDDSVNGYRVESKTEQKEDGMPDTIKSESVGKYVDSTATNSVSIVSDSVNSEIGNDNSSGFVGNKNSKIFHKIDCGSASKMKNENKVYFSNRAEGITQGYTPCKVCEP